MASDVPPGPPTPQLCGVCNLLHALWHPAHACGQRSLKIIFMPQNYPDAVVDQNVTFSSVHVYMQKSHEKQMGLDL